MAVELSNKTDLLTLQFPPRERFSLANQMKRAADSVALNIAEGCTGQSDAEFHRFLGYSLRSAIEVVACSIIADKRGYLDPDDFKNIYSQYEVLCKMITALRKSLLK